jgi:hypothetical protein
MHYHQTQQVLRVHLIGDLRDDIGRGFDIALAGQIYLDSRDQARNLLICLAT